MSTVVSLNAELYQQLGRVADDKSSMKKILDDVKGVVAKHDEEKAAAAREKEETLQNIREAFVEFKAIQDGKDVKLYSWEELENELQREGYFD